MQSENAVAVDPEEQLAAIIEAYLDARDHGERPDANEWLTRYPDIADRLGSFFSCQDDCLGFFAPLRAVVVADSPGTPSCGELFGDYELLTEIGRGGMGVVYKARQVSLDRVVALKMILSGRFASPDDVERFRREAQAAARLQHPHVVAIHEVGELGGLNYFSMDYVDGATLASLIREGPLPPRSAAEYVRATAEAVEYSHQQGIIHRDLKPSNVLIDQAGLPRITDFGLARWSREDSGLTATNALVGTPSYMPPEQVRGVNEPSAGNDVYSLGAVLYELLVGRPPFRAATPMETINQVLESEPPSLRYLDRSIPRDLETICLKCLEKTADKRYASTGQLADDLGRYLRHEPIHARPIGRLERTRRWCVRKPALAGFMVVSLLAFAALLAWGGRELHIRREAKAQLSESLVQGAEALAQRGNWRDALANLDRADELGHEDPLRVELARLRALIALSDSTYPKRLESLCARDDLGSHAAEVYLQQGISLALHGRQDAGIKLLRTAKASRTLSPAETAVADAMLADTSPEAIRKLEQAVKLEPLSHEAQSLLVSVLMLSGRNNDAKQRAEIAAVFFPDSPIFPIALAATAALSGDANKIDEYLQMQACRQFTPEALESYRVVVRGMADTVDFIANGWDIDLTADEFETIQNRVSNVLPRLMKAREHFSGPSAFKHPPPGLAKIDQSAWSAIDFSGLQSGTTLSTSKAVTGAMADLVAESGIPCISRAYRPIRDAMSLRTYGFLISGKGSTERIDRLIAELAESSKIHPDGIFERLRGRLLYGRGQFAESAAAYARGAALPCSLPALRKYTVADAARCYFELYKRGDKDALPQAMHFVRLRLKYGPVGTKHAEMLSSIALAGGDFDAARTFLAQLATTKDESWLALRRAEIELADGNYGEAVQFTRQVFEKSKFSDEAAVIRRRALQKAQEVVRELSEESRK